MSDRVGPDRTSAGVAGVGLLIMAVVAGWANFAIIDPLAQLDADSATLPAAAHQLWAAMLGLGVVAALDVLVAIALLRFLSPVDRREAAWAAGLRVLYAAVFAGAIWRLADGVAAVEGGSDAAVRHVSVAVESFHALWDPGLGIFALHLLVVAWLLTRARWAPRWIAVLVALAGLGYLADAIVSVVVTDPAIEVGSFTFIGEVVLLGWLLRLAVFPHERA